VSADELAFAFQLVQVASNRLLGDRERFGQRSHSDAPTPAELAQDLPLPLFS